MTASIEYCSKILFKAGVLRISNFSNGIYMPEIYSNRSKVCKVEFARLSTMTISCPCANRLKAICEPIKPKPPVTKIIVYLPSYSIICHYFVSILLVNIL